MDTSTSSAAVPAPVGFSKIGQIALSVSDIDRAVAFYRDTLDMKLFQFQERNAAIEREPHMIARMPDHELGMAFFRDPDGNLLALMSQVSAAVVT